MASSLLEDILANAARERGQESGEVNVEELFSRYPCDDRAQEYLKFSADGVISRAVREFKPQREGEADYSALLMSFVKNLRAEVAAGNAGPNAAAAAGVSADEMKAQIEDFMLQYPLDESAYNYLTNSSAEVRLRVLKEFKPKTQGEADYSALCITFTKKCRQSTASFGHSAALGGLPPAAAPREVQDPSVVAAQVQDFCQRYPVDDDTYNYIVNSPTEAQSQLVRDFRPKREGEADYSALVITFAKRCRTNLMMSGSRPGPGGAGQNVLLSADYEAFRAKWPYDQEAHNYLANSPPEVQLAVLRNFQPQREGEADYSALLISFAKRCRQSVTQMGPAGGGFAQPGGYAAAPRGPPLPRPDLEGFLARYPMDENAFAYLQRSPAEVQHQVVNTFTPKRMDDHDFSAPVTAYAKLCRNRHEASSAGHGQGHVMHNPAAELGGFCRRFPMDARALEYLRESPPFVTSRVLREFKPKRDGDTDYSAAIMAFVSVCRKANNFAGAGGVAFAPRGGGFHAGGGFAPRGGQFPAGGAYVQQVGGGAAFSAGGAVFHAGGGYHPQGAFIAGALPQFPAGGYHPQQRFMGGPPAKRPRVTTFYAQPNPQEFR